MHPLRRTLLAAVLATCVTMTAFGQAVETAAGTPTVFDDPVLVQRYQATITPEELAAHLFFFSSDFFEGRETTARGQRMAAHYLAGQYRKLGVKPAGTIEPAHPYAPEAYFQPFTVYGRRTKEARLTVRHGRNEIAASHFSAETQDESAFLAYGTQARLEGPVVFAGYGISDAQLGYDDFAAAREAGISIGGKWILILDDEPLASDSTSLLPTPGGAPSVWSQNVFQKMRAAYNYAVPNGFLIVGDVSPRTVQSIGEAARIAARGLEAVGSLSLGERAGLSQPPLYVVSSDFADRILAPAGRTIAEIQRTIDETLTPVVFEVPEMTVSSRIEVESYTAETENVLAYVEGSDLKDEVVVLTAHFDHIGITARGEINNGADDNGSGTVTMLEVADAFVQAKRDGYGPRRSILFLSVSGEEKGLLGSEFYADYDPVFPLVNTVTNLNMDMVGRHDPTYPGTDSNYVYIIGSNLISEELHEINLRTNELTGVDLVLNERFNSRDDPNQFYARSDQWNFGKHGIPFIFFFTGTHEDYHAPGDEAHKIDYDRMARIGRLIFATTWQIANQDAPPVVTGTGFH